MSYALKEIKGNNKNVIYYKNLTNIFGYYYSLIKTIKQLIKKYNTLHRKR